MRMVEAPSPQPMSARLAPARSFGSTALAVLIDVVERG